MAASRPSGLNGTRRFSLSFVVSPGMPIWHVSQFTRRFWISSISPRRQHQLQRADDAVVQQRPGEPVLGGVHQLQRRVEQPLLLVPGQPAIPDVSSFLFMRTPKRWNGDFRNSGGVCAMPQFIAARSISSARWTVAISTSSA